MNGPGAPRFLLRPVVDLGAAVMALTGCASPSFMRLAKECYDRQGVVLEGITAHQKRMECDAAYRDAYSAMHEQPSSYGDAKL
jgi:hypothetical protein